MIIPLQVPGCWLVDVKHAEGLHDPNEVEFA